MENQELQKIKKLISTLKLLDFTNEDIEKVLKIDKKTIMNIMKSLD